MDAEARMGRGGSRKRYMMKGLVNCRELLSVCQGGPT
jgi:hypothetical protein